ncbi:MAG: hypothetical protein QF689_18315 [Candidatus Latescibacteria bacterium]|nr:hypothetical protein [Gemmatimonadaceae bacterium]MDP6016375.1 hypothetical protein [Candidatus Latescibacterota bacterium]MDP7450545.1 hypothetical protein [Candidatus Latescibacterota bacterium]HJP34170.1 hypothetical protein [Candidatus Latescibacterota bacterium]
MHLNLTERELRMVLDWRRRGAFFPDEDRVLRKLRHALDAGEPLDLSRLQVQIIHGWAEEQLGGPYGGGEMTNPEEAVLFRKIRDALGYND